MDFHITFLSGGERGKEKEGDCVTTIADIERIYSHFQNKRNRIKYLRYFTLTRSRVINLKGKTQ